MRRVAPVLALAVVVSIAATTAHGSDYSHEIAAASREARRFYETGAIARGRTRAARPPAFSCAVAVGGRVVWAQAFGLADLGRRITATPETKFRIGSVSKPLTIAGMALLYERGRLDLDAPIQKYVPTFPDKGYPITLRELAGDLGGIRHYAPDGRDFGGLVENRKHYASLTGGLAIFEHDSLVAPPRTKWVYSSYGFNLIGVAIEHASGMDYLTFMGHEVFGPLGMTHTRGDEAGTNIGSRARPYELDDRGAFVDAPEADLSYKYPSGGMLSTPTDLAIFGSAMIRPGFLSARTERMLFTSERTTDGKDTGYGMGWQLKAEGDHGYGTGLQIRRPRGERYFWHRGSAEGGHAALVIYPDVDVVVACAENTSLQSVPISLHEARRIAAPFIARQERLGRGRTLAPMLLGRP